MEDKIITVRILYGPCRKIKSREEAEGLLGDSLDAISYDNLFNERKILQKKLDDIKNLATKSDLVPAEGIFSVLKHKPACPDCVIARIASHGHVYYCDKHEKERF